MSKGEAGVVLQSAYDPFHPLGGAVSSDHVRDHLHQPLVLLPQPLIVVSQLVESLVCELFRHLQYLQQQSFTKNFLHFPAANLINTFKSFCRQTIFSLISESFRT